MEWVATDKVVVAKVATPADKAVVPRVAAPSLKVTVPVAVLGETVAVKVTLLPNEEGFWLEESVVVVHPLTSPVIVQPFVVVSVLRAEAAAQYFKGEVLPKFLLV